MNSTSATTVRTMNDTAAYGLLDAQSANLLGTYASEPAALRVVTALVRRYGKTSPAVLSLVLYRNDVPEAESVIAEGEALVRRALAAAREPAVEVPAPPAG